MAPVAGPSSGIFAERAHRTNMARNASKSKTNKRIEQERILNRLLTAFLPGQDSSSTAAEPLQGRSSIAAQKAKAVQIIDKDTWSPADTDEIAAAIQGLSLKHSIHLDHELSIALRRCYAQLLFSCERSVRLTDQARDAAKRRALDARNIQDPLIRPDNVSDAVRLLLQLSHPADVTARTAANLMLNATQPSRAQYLTPEQRKQAEKREWLGILVDEPLDGDAWADEDVEQDNSDLSDWSLDSDDVNRLRLEEGYDSDKEIRKRRNRLQAVTDSLRPTVAANAVQQERESWTLQRQARIQSLDDAIDNSVQSSTSGTLTEADAVRESLLALLGYQSVLFQASSSRKVTVADQLVQGRFKGLAGLTEQLQEIASIANTLTSLRSFVHGTISQSIQAVDALTRTPAVEAFSEQVQVLLDRLALSLSELDADISVACMSVHPAPIRTDRYATLTQLLESVSREAASVLLLARLLESIGFIEVDDSRFDPAFAITEQRSFDDRALIDGLQALLGFVHQQDEVAHSENILADLSTCLLAACRPAWKSVCHLIQRGLSFAITRDHDPLFDDRLVQHMIRHDLALPTSDSCFWTVGYQVHRSGVDIAGGDDISAVYSPPAFLQSIMQDVLTTAKGVGLLRSLGVDALGEVQPNTELDQILGLQRTSLPANSVFVEAGDDTQVIHNTEDGSSSDVDEADSTIHKQPAHLSPREAKRKLRQLLFSHTNQRLEEHRDTAAHLMPSTPLSQPDAEPLWNIASARRSNGTSRRLLEPLLGRSLQEHLSPISAIVRKRLIEVLSSPVTEGGYALQYHLTACHSLFLMQRGAEMASWTATLFAQLDRPRGTIRALELYRLNSGFHDALEAMQQMTAGEPWIDANLVRLSTGDEESESIAVIRQRTRLRRLADIQVDYEMPWPLTFVFPQGCMRIYQSMFTMLLQAKYAEHKLSNTLKQAKPDTMHMRKFWSLRRQAQWLVRTLTEYLQRDVLLDGTQRLASDLEGTVSLDSAIQTHAEALEKMATLGFHQVHQTKVKELFSAAWRLGVEVVNNYEQYIGASSQEEDRQARRKRRERRKKRRDKAKREGAPLGVITEADEEEEEGEEEQEEEEEHDYEDGEEAGVGLTAGATLGNDVYRTLGRSPFTPSDVEQGDIFDATTADASMSADISSSWMESETHKRERFRIECERQRKALDRLVEELKVGIDDQIGKVAAKAAMQAQDATQADRALQEHHSLRDKWQGLLYALAWSDLGY